MAFTIPAALFRPRSDEIPLFQQQPPAAPWTWRVSISSSSSSYYAFAPQQSIRKPRSSGLVAIAASSSATQSAPTDGADPKKKPRAINIYEEDANVVQVHTVKQFEEALVAAKEKLVVVEYAASHSAKSRKIYPAMVELSLTCQDSVFILVMGDESDETKELCRRAGIEKVPHFTFYKNGEVIHEEEGISAEELLGDVLYYGDPADNPIVQLHSRQELEELIDQHDKDDKLLVVDVGLKHCGPCVKVYPTVLKLARKMKDTVVFARIHGDENDDLSELLRKMDVVQVPTFLFIRNKKPLGRYVGSGKGELIGEILRHQGVRVTY